MFRYVLDVDDVAIKSAVVAAGGIKPLMIKERRNRIERAPPNWVRRCKLERVQTRVESACEQECDELGDVELVDPRLTQDDRAW